ncbi:MAG: adenylate/guanylate cyclase domain-containing protein [Myxococcota bacterium]
MDRPRVLIVDADRAFIAWLSKELVGHGFDVAVAFDAASGHAVSASDPPAVVVVDATLAGPSGVGFMDHLRDRFAGRPIGALLTVPSGYVTRGLRESFLALDDFALKPLQLPAFVERLHRMVLRIEHLPLVITDLGRLAGRLHASAIPRRVNVTVMFADVRGFTAISETRDPETVAAAVSSILEHLAAGVLRFGGVIDKFLGDGMMALFGVDVQSMDHALAAVYAGQEIIEMAGESHAASLFTGVDLGLGIGLHSGDAVVGPVGPPYRRDVTAIGDTVNMASRLCGEAAAGEVVVSATTYALVSDRVQVDSVRDVYLKGKRHRQRVYGVKLL